MVNKQQMLNLLKQQILDDQVCSELQAQATQIVFGEGNPDSQIVFIGEAPGKKEDLKGVPFIGAAGKFLDEMLATIKLKRSDIYITNIVKYRPPNNRDPLAEEKEAFLPYLRRQLEIISPKLVVTLGRHSMNCFLPELQISECHGQPKRIRMLIEGKLKKTTEIMILPLFHPAAALYNGGLRQTLLDDFSGIPQIINAISN
jgi:uracil-DNA glycosylase family 4